MEDINMTDLDYQNMLDDCYSIPIVEVGALVVPGFEYYNGKPTGQCCRHTDNKKGNFSFEVKQNFAKCFTCQEAFTTINLVKAYKNLKFKNAILFLYQHFPSYFRKEPFSGEYVPPQDNWDGLTNQDYMFLKLPTRIPVGEKMQIREFAKKHPLEHDILLVDSIMNKTEVIEKVYRSFLKKSNISKIELDKIKKDRKEIYKKLLNLLEKGIRNKDLLKQVNKNNKINLKSLLKKLELNQENTK